MSWQEILEKAEGVAVVCHWAGNPALSYLYVRTYGKLPPECERCWKAWIGFKERTNYEEFLKIIPKSRGSRKTSDVIETRFGTRYFIRDVVWSPEDAKKTLWEFNQVARKMGLQYDRDYWANWRQAGKYWEDLFPELFNKKLETYKPRDLELFDLRKSWDKNPEEAEKTAREELQALEKFWHGISKKFKPDNVDNFPSGR